MAARMPAGMRARTAPTTVAWSRPGEPWVAEAPPAPVGAPALAEAAEASALAEAEASREAEACGEAEGVKARVVMEAVARKAQAV